jgi:MerR family transcriptional regulator, thiopeptide resistance regulator
MSRHWKVSEVARLAHVTVRTLHHYDEIGLLVPSERRPNGYRLYDRNDLERLQQIIVLRELDFGLDAIRGLLDAPAHERFAAMRAQRDVLAARMKKTENVIRAVDRILKAMEERVSMTSETMFEGFDELGGPYAEEARERWGDTDAYRESARRTKSYSREDWVRIKAEGDEPVEALAGLMRAGVAPTDTRAMDAADRARLHIDRWFYPCSHEFHANLAAMYEADPRFGDNYEKRAPGLRDYVVAAIRANARRSG